jgi:hypothetical protein
MNYIRHLNAFFSYVKTDQRLTASHVSLYLALFHYWNFNRFSNPFSIYRENIMQLSKLSKNTYHKCLKELHAAQYIYYHPSPSKFQAVRISVIKLEKGEEATSQYKQLDLFTGHKIETDSVANLGLISPNIKTDTVANLRHIYKLNYKQENSVCNTPTKNFEKIDEEEKKKDIVPGVPNLRHNELSTSFELPRSLERGTKNPTLSQIEEFFTHHQYSLEEAKKFFLYNEGKNWMLTEKLPIKNWQSLAHKWMLNVSPAGGGVRHSADGGGKERELKFLYDSFLEGKEIFKHIKSDHFKQLQLQLTDEILNQAWKQRINQLTGTNQHFLEELHKAYRTYNPENELVKRDRPKFISLAKRLAVLNHFHQLKQSGATALPP